MSDLKFAVRQLLKNPGFTAVAVLTLGLGIGANAVVCSWVRCTLVDAIPGAAQARDLVVVSPRHKSAGLNDTMSIADIAALREATNAFRGVTGSQIEILPVRIDGEVEWIWTQPTQANFFDVLGVRPVLGRGFRSGEDLPNATEPVAVISYGLWQRRFGGSSEVLGRVIEVNEQAAAIVGVAPPDFRGTMGGLGFDLWVPLSVHVGSEDLRRREVSHGWRWLHTVGRLRDGVSLREAQAVAAGIGSRLAEAFPASNRDTTLAVLPLWKSPWGGQALFLPLLRALGLVAVLLLALVAANIANLLIARSQARHQEMAVRVALGAAPWRILRQCWIESLVLAALGGVAGIILASLGVPLLTLLMPPTYLPLAYQMRLDGTTLAVTAVLTLLTGLVFGCYPALNAAWSSAGATLKEGSRSLVGLKSRPWLRRGLVAGEIALASVLLLGMGLCVRSFNKAQGIDLGLNPHHLWLAGFRLNVNAGDDAWVNRLYRQLRQEASRLPGVESVGLVDWLPLGFEDGSGTSIEVPGYSPAPGESMSARTGFVSPDYFHTMGIPMLAGRDFRDADLESETRVAVINQALADRFFHGRDPVGLTLKFQGRDARIVGVVKTGKYRALNEPPQPYVYGMSESVADRNLTLVTRAQGEPAAVAKAVEKLAVSLDPRLTPFAGMTYETYMAAALAVPRVAAILLTGLGFVAVCLAALGTYGVVSQNVFQRQREIGVRLALGASPVSILGLVMKQGLIFAAIGVTAGAVFGIAATQALGSVLVGVSAGDLATWIAVPIFLALTTLAACWRPAWWAARVSPMEALRYE